MTAVCDPPVLDPAAAERKAESASRPLEWGLVVLPLALAIAAVRPLGDPDVWWHLRTGELIVDQGLVDRDPWSFASRNTWLLHEWLSEVVMYLSYAIAGYDGVIALASIVIAVFAALVVASCRRVAQPMIACLALVLTSVATMPTLAPRPQLMSWLLLAAVCPYLRRCVEDRRLPWWLVPVVWFWANVHGLWLTVLVLFGFMIIGMAIDEGARGWRVTARFCGLGVLSLAAAALTPSGPALLLAPFHVRSYARFVSEWDPPSITHPAVACALILVLTVVVGWARQQSRVPATTVGFVVGATAMGLLYTRTVPVAAIAVAPLAAAAAQSWCNQAAPRFRFDLRESVIWGVVLLVALPALSLQLSRVADIEPSRHVGSTTTAITTTTARLQQLPGRPRVLNQYEMGGWLLWAARDVSPAIDGRAEIYPVRYVEDYLDTLAMRPGWQSFLAKGDFDAAILLSDTPLTGGLRSVGWVVVEEQDDLLVLLPPPGVYG